MESQLLRRIAEQLNTDTPKLDWDTIPGVTPEEKKAYLLQQAAEILKESPNILADAYGAIQPNGPFQGGHGSPNFMVPLHQLYNSIAGKRKINYLFDGNQQKIIDQGLKQHGFEYDPDVAFLFGGTVHQNRIETVRKKNPLLLQQTIESYRAHTVATIQKEILNIEKQYEQEYGITRPEFAHLLNVGENVGKLNTVGYGEIGSFINKVGGKEKAARLAMELKDAVVTRIADFRKTSMGKLISGKTVDPTIIPNDIKPREILAGIGLAPSSYPQRPQDEFGSPNIPYGHVPLKDLTPEQKKERMPNLNFVNFQKISKHSEMQLLMVVTKKVMDLPHL